MMAVGGCVMPADDLGPTVRVDVLGSLRLVIDGKPVEVRGPKRRAVLAILAMAGGRAVTADHLVDALWPSAPPESGRAALHTHVSRLRGHLGSGAARLVTLDGGYRLALDPGGLDVERARAVGAGPLGLGRPGSGRRVATRGAGALARPGLRGPFRNRRSGDHGGRCRATTPGGDRPADPDRLDAGQVEDVVRLAAEALAGDRCANQRSSCWWRRWR